MADSSDQIAIALRLKSKMKHVEKNQKWFMQRHEEEAKEPLNKAKEAEEKI